MAGVVIAELESLPPSTADLMNQMLLWLKGKEITLPGRHLQSTCCFLLCLDWMKKIEEDKEASDGWLGQDHRLEASSCACSQSRVSSASWIWLLRLPFIDRSHCEDYNIEPCFDVEDLFLVSIRKGYDDNDSQTLVSVRVICSRYRGILQGGGGNQCKTSHGRGRLEIQK